MAFLSLHSRGRKDFLEKQHPHLQSLLYHIMEITTCILEATLLIRLQGMMPHTFVLLPLCSTLCATSSYLRLMSHTA